MYLAKRWEKKEMIINISDLFENVELTNISRIKFFPYSKFDKSMVGSAKSKEIEILIRRWQTQKASYADMSNDVVDPGILWGSL